MIVTIVLRNHKYISNNMMLNMYCLRFDFFKMVFFSEKHGFVRLRASIPSQMKHIQISLSLWVRKRVALGLPSPRWKYPSLNCSFFTNCFSFKNWFPIIWFSILELGFPRFSIFDFKNVFFQSFKLDFHNFAF